MYSIGQLAKLFNLSRGTLLHYDRIGLLSAGGRSSAGYRRYSEADKQRLARICQYRKAGLSLGNIALLLDSSGDTAVLLEQHVQLLSKQIMQLQTQQEQVLAMLKQPQLMTANTLMSKQQWVTVLRNCGMTDDDMWQWHKEFERSQPESHTRFLQSLGIDAEEIQRIKQCSTPD